MDAVYIVELPGAGGGADNTAELGVFSSMKDALDFANKYVRNFGMHVRLRQMVPLPTQVAEADEIILTSIAEGL